MMDGGRFPEGSTTGVSNVKRKKGMNFKIIIFLSCYANERFVR